MTFACVPLDLPGIFYCTFLHAVGYNTLFLAILTIGILSYILWKTNAPMSVALPAIFLLSYGFFTWSFVNPAFRTLFYLVGILGGGLVGYVFLKLFRK